MTRFHKSTLVQLQDCIDAHSKNTCSGPDRMLAERLRTALVSYCNRPTIGSKATVMAAWHSLQFPAQALQS